MIMVVWTAVPLDRGEARPRQPAADHDAEQAVYGTENSSRWQLMWVWDLVFLRRYWWLF